MDMYMRVGKKYQPENNLIWKIVIKSRFKKNESR